MPMPANFTPHYTPILNLLSCSKMAKILAIILFRASNGDSKITPDTLIEEVFVTLMYNFTNKLIL